MDVPSKKSLGLNGEHTALGREFSMHEFKGYMVAKVDSIEKRLDKVEKLDGRIDALEKFRVYLVAFAAGASFIVMLGWEAVKARLF